MTDAGAEASKGEPRPDTGLAGNMWLATEEWNKSWQARHEANLPTTLYHYTDAAGILGIVPKHELWATHASYVNDSSELRYVNGVMKSVIADLKEKFDAVVARAYLKQVPKLFQQAVVEKFEFYLACFCSHGDQLSQWRGYPSTGGGYAIGFDPAVIGQGRMLRAVIYGVAEQHEILRGVLTPACEYLQSAQAESNVDKAYLEKSMIMAAQATVGNIAECSWCFKHPGFAEEKEYRLLLASANDRDSRFQVVPELRARSTGLVPYTPIEFGPPGDEAGASAIVDVVVGPNQHPRQARSAVRHLLSANGYPNAGAMVRKSAIPLRV